MKITIADIAKKAKVSKMTVSRVLSGKGPVKQETHDRIKKIIDEMGYQPNWMARSLASNRSMILGVIIPKIEHMFLDNYIAQILSGVTDVALQNDYRIMLCPIEPVPNQDSEYLSVARSRLLDGMILLKTKVEDPNINVLADSGFPFVLINHKKYSKNINFVDSKNIQGAKMAVQHLYEKGHREIAFIAGSMDETNARDRLKGFREAMAESGLNCPDEWIVYGDFDKDTAYRESEKIFLSSKRPTAIFCSDDYMAIGIMDRIKQNGLKIPEDIAVIGFDDIELADYVKPTLTTIRQPIYELGKMGAQILLKLIDDMKNGPVHKLLNVELVERDST